MYRIFVGQFSDIAVQGDGKIVALAENGSTGLIRLNSDGSIDTSFGQNGEIAAPATSYEFGGKDFLLVQSDGRIVVDWGAGLNRYNSDGSIEATFGDGGTDRLPIWGETVANAPDGSIIVLGVIGSWDTGYRAAVVRLVDFAGIFPQPPGDGGATPLIDASEAASFLPAVAAQYHLLQIGDATVANAGAAAGDLAITAVVTASNLDSSPSSQPAALTIDSPAGASSSSGLAGLDRQLAPASTGPAVLRLDGGSVDAALSDPLGGGADASKADDLLVLDNALTPPFAAVAAGELGARNRAMAA